MLCDAAHFSFFGKVKAAVSVTHFCRSVRCTEFHVRTFTQWVSVTCGAQTA